MSARSYVLPPPAFAQQATSNTTAVTLHAKRGVIRLFNPATVIAANSSIAFDLTNDFITNASTYITASQAEGNGFLIVRVESNGANTARVTLLNDTGSDTIAGPLAVYFEVLN